MNILTIDPVEYAGAVGHVAAAQMHAILTGRDDQNWMAAKLGDGVELPQIVIDLSGYCARRVVVPGQLLTHARISGLYAGPEEPDLDTQWAYDLFTAVSAIARRQLVDYQAAVAQAEAYQAAEPQPLKREDSIFESYGSLGDMEPHQKQFLDDQAAAAKNRQQQEDKLLALAGEISLQVGTPDDAPPLPKLTIGQQETDDAQGTAETGQEKGQAAAAAGEGTEAVRPGSDGEASEPDEAGVQPEGLSADSAAGKAAALPGDDGSAQTGNEAPVKPTKAKAEN